MVEATGIWLKSDMTMRWNVVYIYVSISNTLGAFTIYIGFDDANP
jgi:hypothetical protein